MTVTSATKGLAATVNSALEACKDGTFSDKYAGTCQNLGLVSENPDENYVQLPESTQWGDGFTEDDYKALVKKMDDGDIKVDNSVDVDLSKLSYDHVKVDYQGNLK